jgi:hypothetical protein
MAHKLWISLKVAGIGVGLLAVVLATGADVANAKPAAKAAAVGGPATLDREIRLAPQGLEWGLSLQMVSKVYADALDAEYVPIFKATEPGIEAQRLDAELGEKKSIIGRNRLDFGNQPTGVDDGPLAGEYSYNNGESLTKTMLNGGTQRIFFFYGDRLWKVYDEYKVGKNSPLGTNFDDCVKALTAVFGGAPQRLEPDPAKMRSFQEAVWATRSMHIRAVNRDFQNVCAVVWAERSVHDKLSLTRGKQKSSIHNIDPSVRDVTSGKSDTTTTPPVEDKKKKK